MIIKKTVAQLPLPAVLPLLKKVSLVFVYDQTFFFLHTRAWTNDFLSVFFKILDHGKAPRTPFCVSGSLHSVNAGCKRLDVRHVLFPQGGVNDTVAQGCAHAPHIIPGIGECGHWLNLFYSEVRYT